MAATNLSRLVLTVLSLVFVSVAFNIIRQLFYRDPHKPPIVWHWFPLIGNTVDYGKDPYKFFFRCREKVGASCSLQTLWKDGHWLGLQAYHNVLLTMLLVWRLLHFRAPGHENHRLFRC